MLTIRYVAKGLRLSKPMLFLKKKQGFDSYWLPLPPLPFLSEPGRLRPSWSGTLSFVSLTVF